MTTTTFHVECNLVHDFPTRGHGFTLKAGDVIRVFDGPFGDATILGFNENGEAMVSRPYAYASSVGTTGPTALLGTETYTLTANNLRAVLHYVRRAARQGPDCEMRPKPRAQKSAPDGPAVIAAADDGQLDHSGELK